MAPEALTPETGMLRTEITSTLENSTLKSKAELRDEHRKDLADLKTETRKDLAVIGESINEIKLKQVSDSHAIKNLQQGQTDLQSGQDDLRTKLTALEGTVTSGNKEILSRISELDVRTETITEETAEGVRVTRHFKSWRSVGSDIKTFWPHAVAIFFGYKAIAGWLGAHGITWATIFSR